MADEQDDAEKTEEPSQYRIDESRKKGEVASSKELNTVILLAGTLMTVVLCSAFVYEEFSEYLAWILRLDFQRAYQEKEFIEIINLYIKMTIENDASASKSFGISLITTISDCCAHCFTGASCCAIV